MNDWLNKLVSNEDVCKTAPATPGLLITECFINNKYNNTLSLVLIWLPASYV